MVARAFERDSLFSLIAGPLPSPPLEGDALASRAGLLLSASALIATISQTLPVFFFASCR